MLTRLDDPLALAMAPPADETATERAERLRGEADAKRVNDAIDDAIRSERIAWKKHKAIFKLLLLGQAESGKSTTLKNLQLAFAPRAWAAERASWRAVVQLNLVRAINVILDALAHEMACVAPPSAPAARPYTSPTARPSERSLTPTPAAADDPVLVFTSKHALLKLRLAPLRHVEADLKARLGAASCERTPDDPILPAAAAAAAYSQSTSPTAHDICLYANRSWRDALNRQGTTKRVGHHRRRGSSADPVPRTNDDAPQGGGPPADDDDATEVIAECAQDMQALWEDDTVRAMLTKRGINIQDAPGFFLDDIARIATRTYLPSDDDVVRARLRTLGVQEYRLKFENDPGVDRQIAKEWLIYDVGGSRTSRAAWLPYFEDAHAILFLAPIACFDEHLAEDRRVNRLEDSFQLWKSIAGSKTLARCILILFLNKYDLLHRKLRAGVQVSKHLASFGARENTAPVFAKYMHHKFREQHKELSPEPRSFYGYVTSVIDTKATASTLASGASPRPASDSRS
ncbi:hypothetical protein AcV7_001765 [Taiwanofungus camphoratus]|nr:hypothetical protein AcV7_001765 [Antrodia cinnamomea]